MKIEIVTQSLKSLTKIFLDDEKRIFTINSVSKNIDIDKFASVLLRIVSSWKEKYENDMVVDGLKYEVHIDKDGKKYNFYGNNSFPVNFYEFTNLIRNAENA